MRTFILAALLVVGCAHADTILKNAGVTLGPVLGLDCAADAGLFCQRPTGSTIGKLSCATATATTPGCLNTGDQIVSGTKSIDGGLLVNGPTRLDGGLMVNGPVWIDGSVFINTATVIVDGGLVVKTSVNAAGAVMSGAFYFFKARPDAGVTYLEGDDPSGKLGIGSNGVYLNAGFSLPQSAQLCGYFPGVALSQAWSVAGNRFTGPGQFYRVSSAVQVAGAGDGGLAFDGGATQSMVVSIYDVTTSQTLCFSVNACNASVNFTGSSPCGADAGALFASGDDIDLRVYSVECFKPPTTNICGEYNGLPQ